MGGYNNNPSCRHFKSAYRKLATHVHSLVSASTNCQLQNNTTLFHSNIPSTKKGDADPNNEDTLEVVESLFASVDHDYNLN